MAKFEKNAVVEDAEKKFPVTLTEFCIRQSAKKIGVAILGGFEHSERTKGRLSDMEENFAKRFDEFIKQPA